MGRWRWTTVRARGGVATASVAEVHVGAAIRSLTHDEIVMLTSDPGDIARVVGDRPVRTVHV
jgi:hypothetical protein